MFRYFQGPHHFSTYVTEERTCDICGSDGPGYGGPFYGEDDSVEFVCEPCLAVGQLAEVDLSTNDAGTSDLDERTAAAHLADQEADADELWEAMRPDAPRDLSRSYATTFYLFQCLDCCHYVIHWDCE